MTTGTPSRCSGQELGGLRPSAAGFPRATAPPGWTSARLFSADPRPERAREPAIRLGPGALTAGRPAYGLLRTGSASGARAPPWAVLPAGSTPPG
ncbi:hypothetical protein ACFVFS_37040 [Kitasatospora sp. NPDC057692]|uniref:hypothetical protein n=1 Tax=Kitasatospora sp. NPDC057692 TaxID=3346215 RepID=UPI00368DE6EC